ncbi:MAG: hypothetical protein ABIP71_14150, partial [Verrucomicrobiota bacterium]
MKTRNTYSPGVLVFCLLATLTLFVEQSPAATLLVANNNDSGAGSLRQAILDNATLGGGNGIVFSNIVAGTITLNSQLSISNSVNIFGPGANVLKVSGNNSRRVFNIAGGTVSIFDLTISDGRVLGTNGLSANKGENVVGGGIQNGAAASLTLTSCVISNNAALGGTGGPSNGGGGNGFGGGIYNEGTLTLNQCALDGNTAQGGSGGGAFGMGGEGWGGGLY